MYITVSLLVFILSTALFGRASGSLSLTRLNMISWVFYFNLLLQTFIASLLVISNLDNHYAISNAAWPARVWGWASVQYTMLAMPIAMIGTNFLIQKNSHAKRTLAKFLAKPLSNTTSRKDSYTRYTLYAISLISLVATSYTLASLKEIPIVELLKGANPLTLAELRMDASRNFDGNQYIRNIFSISLSPIIAYIAYAYWRMTRSRHDQIWFTITLLNALTALTYNIAKAPIVFFLLGFIFAKVAIDGKISRKTLSYFFLAATAILALAYSVLSTNFETSRLLSYNSGIAGRILLSQSAGTYLSFEYFPNEIEHIGFSSISDVLSEVTGSASSERSARLTMEKFNPNGVAQGIAGVMNSLYIAEAWANFGIVGVLLSPIYVGIIIQTLYITLIKSKKTPIIIGFIAFFSCRSSVTGGFNDYLYNSVYTIIVLIFLSSHGFSLLLKRKKQLPS